MPIKPQYVKPKYYKPPKQNEFKLLKDARDLLVLYETYTANVPKNYRFGTWMDIKNMLRDAVLSIGKANSIDGNINLNERRLYQDKTAQYLHEALILFPAVRKERFMTPKQEGVLTAKLGEIQAKLEKWVESDKRFYGS